MKEVSDKFNAMDGQVYLDAEKVKEGNEGVVALSARRYCRGN